MNKYILERVETYLPGYKAGKLTLEEVAEKSEVTIGTLRQILRKLGINKNEVNRGL